MSNQASRGDISNIQSEKETAKDTKEYFRFPIPSDWDVRTISEIGEVKGGSTPKTNKEEYWGGGIPWLTPTEVTESRKIEIHETERNITEKGYDSTSTHLMPENSLLLTTRATIGSALINKLPMCTNQGFQNILPKNDVNTLYLYYQIRYAGDYLESLGSGSTFNEISKSMLKNVELPLPGDLPEQRRIASVLYNVDQVIQKKEEIIEQTQRVKKGLMQDLFTEGYYDHNEYKKARLGPQKLNVPRNWSIEKISDFADIKGGKRLPKSHNYAKEETEYPYLRVKDFKGGSINQGELKYLKPKTYEKISRYTIGSEDVYISIAGTLGIAGTIPEHLDGANLTENAAKITNIEGLNNEYLAMYLQSNIGQKEVRRFTVGSTQPKLSIFRIRKMEALVPPKDEQKEIVKTVKSTKKRIEKNKQQKKQLQRIKKGLMQDLLTGKVRTKDKDIDVLDEVLEVEK